jgi:RNA polymerase sigma-70 factor (ECF subfamily)
VTGPSALTFAAIRGEGRVGETVPVALGIESDVQLLALAREDAHQAVEIVYSAYKLRVYTFLLRFTADPDLSDDIVQETFTKALSALPGLPRDQRILPWLYRVAHNAAIDHFRRRQRFVWIRLPKLAGTRHEKARDGDEHALPEREHIQNVLKTLPPQNAAALLLHALEGYSYKEIAEIQGCSMTAVRSRIARAREAFREEYATN